MSRSGAYVPGSVLRNPDVYIRILTDSDVRRPLWEFAPDERPAVMSERRRRFPGLFEQDEVDPEYH